MRIFILVLGLVAMVLGPALAASYDSPKALLQSIYASYDSKEFPEDQEEIYSQRMKDLMAADRARTPEGEIGALDFDPFINGQDYELTELVIGEPVIDGDTASSQVTFKNFEDPIGLSITMVKEADGWKVDDVQSTVGEFQWKLSDVLTTPPEEDTEPADAIAPTGETAPPEGIAPSEEVAPPAASVSN
ncbi:MAG TPA: DUF3828 domain-containing protein [Devosiaceae bacterium]|jgi:hypothetical protein